MEPQSIKIGIEFIDPAFTERDGLNVILKHIQHALEKQALKKGSMCLSSGKFKVTIERA